MPIIAPTERGLFDPSVRDTFCLICAALISRSFDASLNAAG